jgi:hypothetical protein
MIMLNFSMQSENILASVMYLHFGMQETNILEHIDAKRHLHILFSQLVDDHGVTYA